MFFSRPEEVCKIHFMRSQERVLGPNSPKIGLGLLLALCGKNLGFML